MHAQKEKRLQNKYERKKNANFVKRFPVYVCSSGTDSEDFWITRENILQQKRKNWKNFSGWNEELRVLNFFFLDRDDLFFHFEIFFAILDEKKKMNNFCAKTIYIFLAEQIPI